MPTSPARKVKGALRRAGIPLLSYYLMTVLVPLANGAGNTGNAFVEHVAFVVLVPPTLVLATAFVRHVWRRCERGASDSPHGPKVSVSRYVRSISRRFASFRRLWALGPHVSRSAITTGRLVRRYFLTRWCRHSGRRPACIGDRPVNWGAYDQRSESRRPRRSDIDCPPC
jgi:hypothetical protein